MNIGKLLKGILSAALRVVDSDHDGKLELSDLPGALAGLASMQAQGLALVAAAEAAVNGFKAMAGSGQVTSGGAPITAADVEAGWEKAKAPFSQAADEARDALGK